MSIPDRKEIIRIDCKACRGNGFITRPDGEHPCAKCGGVGMLEKQMPWRPEGYSLDEAGEILGDPNPTNRLLPGDPALEKQAPRSDEQL